MSREHDFEEAYHLEREKKHWRKQRRHLQETDRSKFKKTDVGKETLQPIDPNWIRGRVVAITGEGAVVEIGQMRHLVSLRGLLKSEQKEVKNLIAVGDWVLLSPDMAIAHVEERSSILARTDISGKKQQLIAVNVDQLIIAVSLINPPLKTALVDRYLIAAGKGHLHPIIVINKIDLLDTHPEEEKAYQEFLSAYEKLGVPILSLSAANGTGLEAFRSLLKDKTSVISGQSGVGKSSLINAAFHLTLKTGDLAQKTAKGSHTTSSAELLSLPNGGYCVDTPGIRSFAIWKLQIEDLIAHFKEFHDFSCKYPDCRHITEPGCAVQKALENNQISLLRYTSYRTLFDELSQGLDNRTKRKYESD